MAIIDVVKWDGAPNVFAWRFPETNLTTFTQLIVNESQEAVFFHRGKLLIKFGPGKHMLSTENIPILERLYGLPFGGKNPFTAEVWFVNKAHSLNIKWGTKEPFQIRDPEFNVLIPIRARGQFGIKIDDSEKFLVKLVGTLPAFDETNITEYFRGLLMTKTTSLIAKTITQNKISVFDIAPHVDSLSSSTMGELKDQFSDYGIELINFYVNNVSIPEDDPSVSHLKALLSKKAEMDILGYSYQQERSFDVLGTAAENEGNMGGMMGAGMGLGMGLGGGKVMGNMMGDMAKNVNNETKNCPHCNTPNVVNCRFCAGCGKSFSAEQTVDITCDKCNKLIPSGAKFCPHCGDVYNACPNCQKDIPEGATNCPFCGDALPKDCPMCKVKTTPTAKFCGGCGASLVKSCPKCNQEVDPNAAFCGNCGEKLNQ